MHWVFFLELKGLVVKYCCTVPKLGDLGLFICKKLLDKFTFIRINYYVAAFWEKNAQPVWVKMFQIAYGF